MFGDFTLLLPRGAEENGSSCTSRRETTRLSLKMCPPATKMCFEAECGACASSDCNTATTGTVWRELSIFCESFNLCNELGTGIKGGKLLDNLGWKGPFKVIQSNPLAVSRVILTRPGYSKLNPTWF